MRRLLAIFLLLAAGLCAQSIRWDPPGGTLARGQIVQLNLVFENCEPDGSVALPAVPGLEFGQPTGGMNGLNVTINGRSLSVNGYTLAYPVRANTGTQVDIPAFDVTTKQGRLRVAAVHYTVGAATVGGNGAGVPLDSVAQSRFTLPRTVWAGEVFSVGYSLDVLERYNYQPGNNPEWKSAPLLVEDDWSKITAPAQAHVTRGGESYIATSYQTRAYVKTPGEFTLNPATQIAILQTGVQAFGLFSQRVVERYAITSAPASLVVKPLPAPAPAGFAGAVGDLRLAAKVVPVAAAVGEPVTWTLTLTGTGNWPDITALPRRSVSTDFRVISPQAKHTAPEDKIFDATLTEDIVLIPTKPGTYTLGPVKLACFDPKTGQYKNLMTEIFTVTVSGAASAGGGAQESGNAAAAPSAPSTPPASPSAPAGIPRG
ncbi:MAG: BatD family protein, partial [Verrucomicrobiota bacterium]